MQSFKFCENHRSNLNLILGQKYKIICDPKFVNSEELHGIIAIVDENKGNGWYVLKRIDNNQYELISPLAQVELIS